MTSSERPGKPRSPEPTSPAGNVLTEYLVLRAQDGRPEAMELLVAGWHDRLVGHAKRLTGRQDAAEDAVQEAWIAITRGIRSLRDPERFAGWAYGIVTRQCALWLRRHRRRREVEMQAGPPPDRLVPAADEPDEREALQRALLRLEPADRALLHLRYAQGLPLEQIGEAMSLPIGTVKSRLFSARNRLRETLGHDTPTVSPRTLP